MPVQFDAAFSTLIDYREILKNREPWLINTKKYDQSPIRIN
jgi:hypothetical protein